MNRQHVDLADIAERSNLMLALWKTARGRRQQPAVRRWLASADQRLDVLADDIVQGCAPQHAVRQFTIHDPKRRVISAPCLADRVLHHAILNLTEARFERALVDSAYACRPGRGVHAGVAAVRRALQRWPWFVQVDVASYFASIHHARLVALLARRFKGSGFLALLGRIVCGDSGCDRGLPIGALTSQHFANAYLDAADRWLLAQPAVRAHVRYMDDIVWWCATEAEANDVLAQLQAWIGPALALQLKPGAEARPSSQGIIWCGFEVSAGRVLPGPRKRLRYAQAVCRLAEAERAGWPTSEQLQRAHDAALATLAHTQSLHLRQRCWRSQGGVDMELGAQSG